MQITIDLEPETAATIREQASQEGLDLQEYVRRLLQTHEGGRKPASGTTMRRRATVEEFERDLDLFSEGTENLPPLTAEDLTRAALYADHD